MDRKPWTPSVSTVQWHATEIVWRHMIRMLEEQRQKKKEK